MHRASPSASTVSRALTRALSLAGLLAACADDAPLPPAPPDDSAVADGAPGADAATPDGAADDAGPVLPPTFGDAEAPADTDPPPDTTDDGADPRPPWLWPDSDRPVAAHYPPAALGPLEAPPLLILLHGFGASGAIQDAYLGVSREATARGWVVLTPDGIRNRAGKRFWNAAPSWCCDFDGSGVDDTAWLTDLIDHATARLGTDPARVALLGHSNGGYMAHHMACDRADRVAAFASLAGGLPLRASDCAPSRPVPALHIHGTLDTVVLYAGQLGVYVGADAIVARWADYNRCNSTVLLPQGDARDFESTLPWAETAALGAAGCEAPAELWRVTGGSHVPAFNATFMPAVLAWLEAAVGPDEPGAKPDDGPGQGAAGPGAEPDASTPR
jgi:polyhydroxybutyrate depolymerase